MASFDKVSDEGGWVWFPGDYSPLKDMPRDMKRRHIEDRAKKDAEQNIPATDSKEPIGGEAEIWNRAVNGCGQLASRFSENVNSCLKSIRTEAHIEPTFITAPVINPAAESVASEVPDLHEEVESIISTSSDNIRKSYEEYLEAKRKLVNFQQDNGLERDAKYPASVFLVVGVMMLLAVLETALNGFMFRDVADGFVGGAFLAFMLSVVNILSGVVFGFFGARYLLARGVGRKIFGLAFVLVFGAVGIFLNFFVAHFRELAADFDGFNAVQPLQHMLNSPFGLDAPEAFILLIFGLLIFIFAAYEGYSRIFDKYPGYQAVDENYRDAQYRSEMDIKYMREDVEEALADYRDEYEDKIESESRRVNGAKASLRKLSTIREDALVSIDKCISDGNSLLSIYRLANTKRRLGVTIPRFASMLTREDAMQGELEDTEPVEDLIKETEKAALSNKEVYKARITASFAYGREAASRMSEFLDMLKDRVASDNQLGRNVMSDDDPIQIAITGDNE